MLDASPLFDASYTLTQDLTVAGSGAAWVPDLGLADWTELGQLTDPRGSASIATQLELVENQNPTNTTVPDLISSGAIEFVGFDQSFYPEPLSAVANTDPLTGMTADDTPQVATFSNLTGGSVIGQGDLAMNADIARQLFGVDGTGITIGVISDSFDAAPDALTRAAQDFATGDLPPDVVVLKEADPAVIFPLLGGPPTDEGRGMMQLIHDVAPGARLLFHTAGSFTDQDIAAAIRALAAAGADIIVDDVRGIIQPFFQDGFAAQAVDEVVAQGVTYFTSAGNARRDAYQSPFRDSGITFNPFQFGTEFLGGTAHDFDPGPGVDIFQSFTLKPSQGFQAQLQWDQPFASISSVPVAGSASSFVPFGVQNELDFYIFDRTGTQVVYAGTVENIGADPVEIVRTTNSTAEPVEYNLALVRRQGDSPGLMRYRYNSNSSSPINLEYATNSSPMQGHKNAAGAIAVGAADYRETPRFGVNPPILENFSSVGPTPILFDTAGNRLPQPDIRSKPDIVAPNGSNTTFFGNSDPEGDGFPNFFGTSAAAPYAAAVAALMLQAVPSATPAAIRTALQSSAIDMGTPGFDYDSGFGFIQADRAIQALRSIVV